MLCLGERDPVSIAVCHRQRATGHHNVTTLSVNKKYQMLQHSKIETHLFSILPRYFV